MDSLGDLLKKKADDIDLEAKSTDLELAQKELDRQFDGQVKVHKITDDGVLLTKVRSSVVASELRFRQVQIADAINKSSKQKIISIRSLAK
jgi:hypothetical protein